MQKLKCKKLGWKILFVIIILLVGFIFWQIKFAKNYVTPVAWPKDPNYFGITFSQTMATSLGLDWQKAYLAMLDELQVKNVRIPVYFDVVEPGDGKFDFSDYDFMLKAGAKRNVKFILTLGRRAPRWPECHAPAWLAQYDKTDADAKIETLLTTVVERYKNNPEVIAWQVENEPLLNTFGECPPSDVNFLAKEATLVRSLDKRPVIITGSGELSSWKQEGQIGDFFGTTMYRVVWNKYFGYFRYIWPPLFYQTKAKLAGIDPSRAIIIELQAEPWVPNGNLSNFPEAEAKESFSPEQFKANIDYAVRVNFHQVYLWGVEYWYLEAQRGNNSYWDLAKTLFK